MGDFVSVFIDWESFGAIFGLEKEIRSGFGEPSKSCRLILNLNSSTLSITTLQGFVLGRVWGWFLDPKSIKNQFIHEA